MVVYLLSKLLLIFLIIKKSGTICTCTQQNQEVICNENIKPNQVVPINEMLSSNTALPFQGITILRLQCNLKTLSTQWFANLNTLKEFDVSMNKISRIPIALFIQMPHLEVVNMSHNILRNPSEKSFTATDNVKVLDLSFNRISNIEASILHGMKQLQGLYVSHNGLFDLLVHTFEGNLLIKEINMSHNHIRSIDKLQFKYNLDVERLNFAANDISEILELDTFTFAKRLKYLNLSNSNVKLAPKQFINNAQLIMLDLSKNSFENLPPEIFNPLISLKTLNLASCQLLYVANDLLHQNPKLKLLDLSSNNLRQFPSHFFDKAENLETLNISNNLFKHIPRDVFQKTRLVTLDISNNRLNDVTPDLIDIPSLENVYLQNNKLKHLNALSNSPVQIPVKYMNLEFNEIVFLRPELFNVLTNLKEIEIMNNPWNCRCFEELVTVLAKMNVTHEVGDHREGTVPICVVADICDYNESNLTYYYDTFKKNHK